MHDWVTRSRIYLSRYFPPEAKARLSSAFFAGGDTSGGPASWQYEIERFRERAQAFGDALSRRAKVRRLNSAEMFHDLHLCLTGLEHPIALPCVPIHLDEALADQHFFGGLYPRVGQLHIRPVAIDSYPTETIPQLLWFMLHERGWMRFTLRWLPQMWRRVLDRAGVKYRPIGQTRHTYAAIMLQRGAPLPWLQRQMGHTTSDADPPLLAVHSGPRSWRQ